MHERLSLLLAALLCSGVCMLSRVDRTRLLAGAIAMLVVGCTSTNDLLVFLETDLRPGSGSTDEFDSVEIEVTRGGIRVRDDLVDAGTLRFSAHRSTRIGVFRGLPSADYVVAVTLFAGPDTVIRYPAHVHVASDYTLTVRLSRSCSRTVEGRAAYERCAGAHCIRKNNSVSE